MRWRKVAAVSSVLLAVVAFNPGPGPMRVDAHFSSLAVTPSQLILGEAANLSFNLSKRMKVPEGVMSCRARLVEANLTLVLPPQLAVTNLTVSADPQDVEVSVSGRRISVRHREDVLSVTLRASVIAPLNSTPGVYPIRVLALGKEILPNESVRYLNATQKIVLTVGSWHPAAELRVFPSRITPPGRIAVRVDVGNPSALWVVRPGGRLEMVNLTIRDAAVALTSTFMGGQDVIRVGEVGPGRVEVINRVYDLPDGVPAGAHQVVALVSGSVGPTSGSVIVRDDLEIVEQADVRVESLDLPAEVDENSTFPVNITVRNYSPFPAKSVSVRAAAGGVGDEVYLGDLGGYEVRSVVVNLRSGGAGNLTVEVEVSWRDAYPPQAREASAEAAISVSRSGGSGGGLAVPADLMLVAGALAVGLVMGYAWRRPKAGER